MLFQKKKKQKNRKVLSNQEMKTEVDTIFLVARGNNQTLKIVNNGDLIIPFSSLQNLKTSTSLLWIDE